MAPSASMAMNELILEPPLVSVCEVSDCAYNLGSNCHARAITIGNGAHPGCDTFFSESHHIRKGEQIAGIGACKVASCQLTRAPSSSASVAMMRSMGCSLDSAAAVRFTRCITSSRCPARKSPDRWR